MRNFKVKNANLAAAVAVLALAAPPVAHAEVPPNDAGADVFGPMPEPATTAPPPAPGPYGEISDDPGMPETSAPRTATASGPATKNAPPNPLAKESTQSSAPAPRTAESPKVAHSPVSSAPANQPLTVTTSLLAPHEVSRLTLHYRRAGEKQYREADFALDGTGRYSAQVPAGQTEAGVIEYYIGSRSADDPEAPERIHFASEQAPHPVIVEGAEVRWRRELLASHLGNRSRFMLDADYVDFGQRQRILQSRDGGTVLQREATYRDYYYRLELDYTYRMLSPVYSIRIGAGVLRGDTFIRSGSGNEVNPPDPVGLTYGFAEVRFRVHRIVRLNLRGTLGAGSRHFDGGAGGELLIGYDPGTHFAVGVDGVSTLGIKAWVRLAWNTVPHLPMSFTAEATNLPLGGELGGRAFLAASYRFHRHFSMNAHVGYAFRDFRVGGPVAGLTTMVEF